jgi:hypothetical protein
LYSKKLSWWTPPHLALKSCTQVTDLERGQVSRKITQRQRFRRHLRFIEKHRGKAGFDICVVRPEGHPDYVGLNWLFQGRRCSTGQQSRMMSLFSSRSSVFQVNFFSLPKGKSKSCERMMLC